MDSEPEYFLVTVSPLNDIFYSKDVRIDAYRVNKAFTLGQAKPGNFKTKYLTDSQNYKKSYYGFGSPESRRTINMKRPGNEDLITESTKYFIILRDTTNEKYENTYTVFDSFGGYNGWSRGSGKDWDRVDALESSYLNPDRRSTSAKNASWLLKFVSKEFITHTYTEYKEVGEPTEREDYYNVDREYIEAIQNYPDVVEYDLDIMMPKLQQHIVEEAADFIFDTLVDTSKKYSFVELYGLVKDELFGESYITFKEAFIDDTVRKAFDFINKYAAFFIVEGNGFDTTIKLNENFVKSIDLYEKDESSNTKNQTSSLNYTHYKPKLQPYTYNDDKWLESLDDASNRKQKYRERDFEIRRAKELGLDWKDIEHILFEWTEIRDYPEIAEFDEEYPF